MLWLRDLCSVASAVPAVPANSTSLHHARSICRRAERSLYQPLADGTVSTNASKFLNRSAFRFVCVDSFAVACWLVCVLCLCCHACLRVYVALRACVGLRACVSVLPASLRAGIGMRACVLACVIHCTEENMFLCFWGARLNCVLGNVLCCDLCDCASTICTIITTLCRCSDLLFACGRYAAAK